MFVTYKITCRGNAKNYYGSTSDITYRKFRHFNDLKNNQHINKHMQNAYNKYGLGAFYIEIINEFNSRDEMINAEQQLLDKYLNDSFNKSTSAKGPLLYGIANGFFGKKHTDESKKKMRLMKLGKPTTNKTVITDLGVFNSLKLACQYHGIYTSTYYKRLKRNATNWILL
jgi:group I intron endonuclease